MRYPTFLGNDGLKRQISALMDTGRFPHALLLEGPTGSGKRTLAREIAQAAVCRADGAEKPCGVCPDCVKAVRGAHPDITLVGEGIEARSLSVEAIRALREKAFVLPNEAARRVFLLFESQAMTEQAQNALLKILEEPPRHVMILLTCENRSQLLPTILSRVNALTLEGVELPLCVRALRDRFPDKPEEELLRAARVFGGVIGQAGQALEDGAFQRVVALLPAVARGIAASSDWELLCVSGAFEKDKDAFSGVLSGLRLMLRDALAADEERSCLSPCPAAALALRSQVSPVALLRCMDAVDELQKARKANMNYTLLLTLFCRRLRQAAEPAAPGG